MIIFRFLCASIRNTTLVTAAPTAMDATICTAPSICEAARAPLSYTRESIAA